MTAPNYTGYRFPPDVIQQAVWMYLRFTLSYRDVEDLLAERGIAVTYESIRRSVRACHVRPNVTSPLEDLNLVAHPDKKFLMILKDGRISVAPA